MERHIVHCDLDTFFVSVERLDNPALTGKPVLIGGNSDRGVVASCSYEARRFGVHSAMPMKLARQLCPEAILVRGDMNRYSELSRTVTEIIGEQAPLVEKASIDEHYIDITGMDRFFGCWKWTQELRQRIIQHTGLPISFGLSTSKTVAKIATGEAKPSGECQVSGGSEKTFLGPLSIRKIPMVGEKTYLQLRNMGISKVNTLQQMEAKTLQKVLGVNGVTLWKKANGIDNSPVIPFSEKKSISKEHTFQHDTIDIPQLTAILCLMVDELAFELRKSKKLTACITLKIRYSNFDTHTQQVRIPFTSSEKVIIKHVLELFSKLYSRRMLIRLVGVRFGELLNGFHQIDLFEDTQTDLNLSAALDRIRLRYGMDAVKRVIQLEKKNSENA